LRQLPFAEFAINLLVLSACQTALGAGNAELGFAGLAVNSGVQTALASIWQVSDAGTLALMGKFYQHLQDHSLKAEALRQAQLDLLNQAVRLENGSLRGVRGAVALPPELNNLPNENLSHPYYWAGFVTIGAPW
jgi:CHAT domain-containing protein